VRIIDTRSGATALGGFSGLIARFEEVPELERFMQADLRNLVSSLIIARSPALSVRHVQADVDTWSDADLLAFIRRNIAQGCNPLAIF
jgi:hypothetical protein